MLATYEGAESSDYIVYFANHLDPNGGASVSWPKYDTDNRQLLEFGGSLFMLTTVVSTDTYRAEQMAFDNTWYSNHTIL